MSKKGQKPKGAAAKVGRGKRCPLRLERRYVRSYANKLNRVNRDRAKSGKPALGALSGYDPITGYPDGGAPRT